MSRCIGVVLALAVIALPVHVGGQTPSDVPSTPRDEAPVFRSGVEAVRFEAIVTDRNGKPITDLTADDFEIREDDTPQAIEQFLRVSVPLPQRQQSKTVTVRSDVRVNDQSQDRVYVIVLDRMSWPMAVRGARIVHRFLDDFFADADQAAIITLDRGAGLHFTNDRRLMREQTDAFVERAAHPEYLENLTDRDYADGFANNRARLREQRTRQRAELFGSIARALSHIEARRKSIIYVSDGLDIDPYDAVDTPTSSFSEDARAMMEPIMAGNLSVYPFYPGPEQGALTLRTMRALAYVTGGVPISTDITGAFNQIVSDNSAYYVLGYQSTNPRRDGGFRRIHVDVKRKGAKVRARSGYFVEFPPENDPYRLFSFNGRRPTPREFVPPSDLSPALTKAMESPVTLTAVPIRVFAAAHKTASRNDVVTVTVEIPASALDLTRTNDEVSGQVDLAIGATSGLRTIRGTGFTYDVRIRGQALDEFDAHGLRMTAEIPLEPGDYRLGVVAGGRGGRVGKTFYDFVVPDFTQPLLALSGISLSSASAAATVTLQPPAPIRAVLPGPVTVARRFDRVDALVLYTEVYENIWWTDAAHTITLTTELRAADGTVIPVTTERRPSGTAQLKEGGHPFTARIPLANVPPGAYVLHVEAQSDFDKPRSVAQDVPIEVQ